MMKFLLRSSRLHALPLLFEIQRPASPFEILRVPCSIFEYSVKFALEAGRGDFPENLKSAGALGARGGRLWSWVSSRRKPKSW